MNKTAITVTTDAPADPKDHRRPFGAVMADMTGARPEPADDDATAPVTSKFRAVHVTPKNYQKVFETVWEPRFRGTVPDVLTGNPDGTIAVDIAFKRSDLISDVDTIPELVRLGHMIRDLESLQSRIGRDPVLRNRLDRILHESIDLDAK